MKFLKSIVVAKLCFLFLVGSSHFLYAQQSYSIWEKHNPNSSTSINHSLWSQILGGIVYQREDVITLLSKIPSNTSNRIPTKFKIKNGEDINYINYKRVLSGYGQYVQAIDVYLRNLRTVEVSKLNRNEQLAFWLNVRNALVLKVIFENFPLDDDEMENLYLNEGWETKKFLVEGYALSIRDIEEKIILKNWSDPIVIYGLFYGAKSGPFIMKRAFTGKNVYRLLEENARNYLQASGTIDVSTRKGFEIPLVYKWHEEIFHSLEGGLQAHLVKFASSKDADKIRNAPEIYHYEWDWDPNQLPSKFVRGIQKALRVSNSTTGF